MDAQRTELINYREQLTEECHRILDYWSRYTVDTARGGFAGRIDNGNTVIPDAPKGLVLNARILWTFSAAFRFTKEQSYLSLAHRAADYLFQHFLDKINGGAWWLLTAGGEKLDGRKQTYGQAFLLYGMSEYFAVTQNQQALTCCIELFHTIEQYAYEPEHGGYLEAFAEDWSAIDDFRLSEKDLNLQKTMNTHLHLVEAYANLYRVWPDAVLKQRVHELLKTFELHMIDPVTYHLRLFFDNQWNESKDVISYGHDIEAAWLLATCAEYTGEKDWVERMNSHTLMIADAAAEGLDEDGGIWYEFNTRENMLIKEKHWWPQAEAMIGFFHAWEISGNTAYLNRSIRCWNFIRKYLLDYLHGEWYWGVDAFHQVMQGQDKIGFWKCPYHNVRACLEIIMRIDRLPAR